MILKEVECVPGTVNFHRMLNTLLINGIMLGEAWKQCRIKQRRNFQSIFQVLALENVSRRLWLWTVATDINNTAWTDTSTSTKVL